jgi:hypothetical protein
LHHRFVVGGYVCKRVTLRISKGLRVVALAAGISRRVYSDTRFIFITIIAIYIVLAEKIGTPLIREGPCADHRGILFAFFFCLFYRFVFSFLGIWGFFVFQLFLQLLVSGIA